MEPEKMSSLRDTESKIEAILFASGEPVESERIARVLDIDEKTVKNLIDRIRSRYLEQHSPFDIIFLAGSYQMHTRPEYEEIIREVLILRRAVPLSPAALEVLAVVAYNQPVTRALIEQVRGVDCAYIVRSLAEKGLIEEAGRLDIPGRPIAYKTTPHFLRSFGLESLDQLPTLPSGLPETNDPEDDQLEGQIDFFKEQG